MSNAMIMKSIKKSFKLNDLTNKNFSDIGKIEKICVRSDKSECECVTFMQRVIVECEEILDTCP